MADLRPRRVRTGLAVVTVGVLALGAACSSSDNTKNAAKSKGVVTPETVTIRAGVSDPTHTQIAVLQFMPARATVSVGQKARWSWDDTKEPHTVTFFPPGQSAPAPGSDPSLFAPTPPKGAYDGTTLVNSGLVPQGPQAPPPFEMTFAKA